MSATHSHSDKLLIAVMSVDVCSLKKFTSTNHKEEREMREVCDIVCARRVSTIMLGKPECQIPLGRPRHRWEDHIKMEFNDKMRGIA